MTWLSKPRTHCRVCQAPLGKPYLDLGAQPLANALVKWEEREAGAELPQRRAIAERVFPLQVILCEQCGLSQLSVVVNPEVLYAGYRFRSGASPIWVKHCEELAKRCTKEWDKFPPGSVLDVACNDGTQLDAFVRRGWRGLGVDPSLCGNPHAPTVEGFWGPDLAATISKVEQPFDLIIAQNVLGHVDDPIAFLRACKTVLAPEGRVVVEVPDAFALLRNLAFDTIYHEHLSYWTRSALRAAAEAAELVIERNDSVPVHGGSRRYWLKHRTPRPARRFDAMKSALYGAFAHRVQKNLNATADLLGDIWNEEKKLIGWGAAAKASVYLNAISRQVANILPSAVIDETPEKQGMLMPGVHIPVIAPPEDLGDVDILWILSWNNAQAIKEKARSRGFKGKYLLTNGTPRLED